jgi:protein required for attachment to host cells
MKPIVTWVLIVDGRHARILEHAGPGKGLTQVDGMVFLQQAQNDTDLAETTGELGKSVGVNRNQADKNSFVVEVREEQFVKSVAELVNQKCSEHAFDRLVVAAAPTALGDLRPQLSPAVKKACIAELPKDLTNVPTDQLQKHFDGILAV